MKCTRHLCQNARGEDLGEPLGEAPRGHRRSPDAPREALRLTRERSKESQKAWSSEGPVSHPRMQDPDCDYSTGGRTGSGIDVNLVGRRTATVRFSHRYEGAICHFRL